MKEETEEEDATTDYENWYAGTATIMKEVFLIMKYDIKFIVSVYQGDNLHAKIVFLISNVKAD